MDLPDTLEGVLREIVRVCRVEYDRLAEAGLPSVSSSECNQAYLTLLVAQKDLLAHLDKTQYQGAGWRNNQKSPAIGASMAPIATILTDLGAIFADFTASNFTKIIADVEQLIADLGGTATSGGKAVQGLLSHHKTANPRGGNWTTIWQLIQAIMSIVLPLLDPPVPVPAP